MRQFDPAHLSPLPRPPEPCGLPYGLGWADVTPALPGFDPAQSVQAQAFVSYQKQGLNGGDNSCILTLRYPDRSGSLGEKTLFIKAIDQPAEREAEKFRFLAARAVPTPHLLAAIDQGAGEVILLEFLPIIGIHFDSPSEASSLLELVARLNAVQNPPPLFDATPRLPQAEFDASVSAALDELTRRQLLRPSEAPLWFAAYQTALEAAQSMATALNHNQMYFQQVGWAEREYGRELVLFDLETMIVCPRFTDIAGLLFSLAIVSGRSQQELFQVYVQHLEACTGQPLPIEQAWRELRLLRVRENCFNLPWLVGAQEAVAADLFEQLELTLTCLRQDIAALAA